MSEPALAPITINGVTIDFDAGLPRDATGVEVPLRAQSFAVLRELARSAGRVVSKDALMVAVWQGVAVTDDSLVQCIGDIRRALHDEAQAVLRTVPRRGYRLDLPSPPAQARSWRVAIFAFPLLALAALLAVVATFAFRTPEAPVDRSPSIAVLPFDDMSAGGGYAYLGEGVAEDIIAMLARSADVRVVARYSSFVYGGTPVDIRKIGVDLGVGYVLEGSVRRDGDKLRIVAQLNDARTGEHVWAERFDEAGADPMKLMDAVSGKIIGALTGERGELRSELFRTAWARNATALDEYDYYLRGVDLMHSQFSAESNAEVARIVQEGLAAVPESALLKILLAWTHWRSAYNFWSDDPQADFAMAGGLAREVLATPDPTLRVQLTTQWLLGYVNMREGNFAQALAAARKALALAPYDPFMSAELADIVIASARNDEALEMVAKGEAGNPANADFHHILRGWIYRLQGEPERSIEEYALATWDGAWMPLQYAISLVRLDRIEDAREQVRAALAKDPDMTLTVWRDAVFYSEPSILDGEIADLAAAGLPE